MDFSMSYVLASSVSLLTYNFCLLGLELPISNLGSHQLIVR